MECRGSLDRFRNVGSIAFELFIGTFPELEGPICGERHYWFPAIQPDVLVVRSLRGLVVLTLENDHFAVLKDQWGQYQKFDDLDEALQAAAVLVRFRLPRYRQPWHG